MTRQELAWTNTWLSVQLHKTIRRMKHYRKLVRAMTLRQCELLEERDTLLAERERHTAALEKARLAISSQTERKRFDELYRIAMGEHQ